MKGRQPVPLYPFLLAVYPVLFLFSRNRHFVSPGDCVKPIVIVLAFTGVLLLLARLLLKNNVKSGVLVSVLLVLLFSYGHVVDVAFRIRVPVRSGLVVLPLWLLLGLASVVFVARTRRSLVLTARYFRAVSLVMIAVVLIQVLLSNREELSRHRAQWQRHLDRIVQGSNALKVRQGTVPPDIYLIIVDAYSRSDVLKSEFGFDNGSFVRFLEGAGFYVPEKSATNYLLTALTLSSMMNMSYLEPLNKELGFPIDKMAGGSFAMHWPAVVRLLRDAGYNLVVIPSRYAGLEPVGADFSPKRARLGWTEFDYVLMDSTMLRALPSLLLCGSSWRKDMSASLDYLLTVPDIDRGPVFAYAHLDSTHPPFCFSADGSPPASTPFWTETHLLPKKQYAQFYAGCIEYTNRRLEQIISRIISRSKIDPIIIVLADHGATCGFPVCKAKAFAAYHLPHGGNRKLYPSVTPVNAFRIVFDSYFGTNYGLVRDHTYVQECTAEAVIFREVDPEKHCAEDY